MKTNVIEAMEMESLNRSLQSVNATIPGIIEAVNPTKRYILSLLTLKR